MLRSRPESGARLLAIALVCLAPGRAAAQGVSGSGGWIELPEPVRSGRLSVEEALDRRRSVRRFADGELELRAIAQILWSAQGVTAPMPQAPPGFQWEWRGGLRTTPSAGALYPIEVLLVAAQIETLAPGQYRYHPVEHALEPLRTGADSRPELTAAALGQGAIREAPACIVITGVEQRSAVKYGRRAARYVQIEVGAVAQNVYLAAEAAGLGTVFLGAFDDAAVSRVLDLQEGERPHGIMPIGRPARD